MKTQLKEGDIKEELIDKMAQLLGKYKSFDQAFNPSVFRTGLFEAAHGWGDQKGTHPWNLPQNINCVLIRNF